MAEYGVMKLIDLALARALHVLAVVVWIGGVAMVTTVTLPAMRRGDLGPDRLKVFETIERRFALQARIAVLVTGATGVYMIWRFNLWDRFRVAAFWWMHAMIGVWILFFLLLFVLEPFVLHRYFARWAAAQPRVAFAWLHGVHWVMLVLSLITILGAVAGSHGAMFWGG